MPKEMTPQQEHQRKVWEEARTCKPREPQTEAEIKAGEVRHALRMAEINVLLDHLNDGGETPRTSMTIMINGEPEEFNISSLESALRAQNFGWTPHYQRQEYNARIDADQHLFPGIEFEKEGEKVIKKTYTFDSTNRKVVLVVTRCTPLPNGDTWDTPRYDETYESVTEFDNLHWRCIINDMISLFGAGGFVHLYSHDFMYIWDHETCQTTIKPKQPDGTYITDPKPIGPKMSAWKPSPELADQIGNELAELALNDPHRNA